MSCCIQQTIAAAGGAAAAFNRQLLQYILVAQWQDIDNVVKYIQKK